MVFRIHGDVYLKELLRKGVVWRVGTGSNINISSDPWIPRGSTRRFITQKGRNVIDKVSDLIDPFANSWDKELVKQTFVPEDADIILQIPIQEHTDDFIACHYDKKGMLSVKSAYRVVVDSIESPSGLTSTSSADEGNGDFNWPWSLPFPNKVLHFLWQPATTKKTSTPSYANRHSPPSLF
jgi:hypothetical protein